MQLVSDQIASRSELLELAETLGMYARFEQTNNKRHQLVTAIERPQRSPQTVFLRSKNRVVMQ